MPDGLQIFLFANKQVEKHYKDGKKEILFKDGTKKVITEDEEISYMTDGTVYKITKDGNQTIENIDH